MEDDSAAGRLDALADEALEDLRAGRCTDGFGIGPIQGFGLVTGNFLRMYVAWLTNPTGCFYKTRNIHLCISSGWDAFGPLVSACITARLPWNMARSWCGFG